MSDDEPTEDTIDGDEPRSDSDHDLDLPAGVATDVRLRPIEEIEPYAGNPKRHPDEQIEKIANSIADFGWDVPIVVDSAGEIVKGHGRYQAAKRLGFESVPVIERDFDDTTARAARIADNRSSESDWEDETLAIELELLEQSDYDLEATALDDDEIDNYLHLLEPPEPLDEPQDADYADEIDDGGEGHRVVIIAETDGDAEFVGEWAADNGFEWHVVDK